MSKSTPSDKPKSTKKSKSKYKFHEDYLTEVGVDEKAKGGTRLATVNRIEHPQLNNDDYWREKYSIVNMKEKHPTAFQADEFEQFYEYIAGGNSKKPMEKLLFTGHTVGKFSSKSEKKLSLSASGRGRRPASSHSDAKGRTDKSKKEKKSGKRVSRSADRQ